MATRSEPGWQDYLEKCRENIASVNGPVAEVDDIVERIPTGAAATGLT